mgnify:CR=1 FL=1
MRAAVTNERRTASTSSTCPIRRRTRRGGHPCRRLRSVRIRYQGAAVRAGGQWSMGHELGGEIVAVGSAVDGLEAGHEYRCAAGHLVWLMSILSEPASVSHCPLRRSYIGWGRRADSPNSPPYPRDTRSPFPPSCRPHCSRVGGTVRGGPARCAQRRDRPPVTTCSSSAPAASGLTTLAWAPAEGGAGVSVADPDPPTASGRAPLGATDVFASACRTLTSGAYDAAIECVGRLNCFRRACQPALATSEDASSISGAVRASRRPSSRSPRCSRSSPIRYSVAYSTDEFHEVIAAFGSGDVDPRPTIGPTFELARIAGRVRRRCAPGQYGAGYRCPVRLSDGSVFGSRLRRSRMRR